MIRRWLPGAGDGTASLPISRLTLNFDSPLHEAAYRQQQYLRSLPLYRTVLFVSLLVHVYFIFVDPQVLHQDAWLMTWIRTRVLIPTIVFGLVASLAPNFERFWQPMTAIFGVVNGLAHPLGTLLMAPSSFAYHTAGSIMVVTFITILFGLRFTIAAAVCSVILVAQTAALFWRHIPSDLQHSTVDILASSVVLLLIGTYRTEWLSRAEYFASDALVEQEKRARATEVERSRWLGMIAGFVRHELKNAIAGISSSLQLVAREPLRESSQEYVRRATHSLQYMRRFLQQVGDASSLETALKQQEMESVPLSDLVAGRVEDFRHQRPDRRFDGAVAEGIEVRGNADSLVQMLDKLVNNALEHAEPGSPVTIGLRRDGSHAVLEVADRGDALPADAESLFQPFVSSKSAAGEGNLGLGLYVARIIATHHEGEIRAERLVDPTGARLVVRLPLQSAPSRGA